MLTSENKFDWTAEPKPGSAALRADAHPALDPAGARLLTLNKNMRITRACVADAGALTEIAFAAKRHWGYPEDWIRRWQEALTITPEYITANPTFVAAVDGKFVGFCAVHIEAGE